MSGVTHFRRSLWLVFALTAALLAAFRCFAAEPTVRFDVPSGPLDKALLSFAAQAKMSVLAGSAHLDGKVTPALKGDFTPSAALTRLLAGQALHFEQIDPGTVTIETGAPPGIDTERKSAARRATESSVASAGQVGQPSRAAGAKRLQKSVEEVVVTGSYIKSFATLFPVETYSGKQLGDQGYTEPDQFFAQLPANFAGISQASNPIVGNARGAGTNQTFGVGVDLGGLGPGTTLVLWNGHRLPSGVIGESVDISSIPLGAIDRIDIMTDGASATYGSDALGGVVNIVTVSDFVGLKTTLRADEISPGKGANPAGSIMAGNAWSGGGAMLMIDNQQDYPLPAAARRFSANADEPTDLLPEQRVTSGYASVHQESDNGLVTRIDVLMSGRRFNAYDALYGYPITLNGRANQLDTVLQLDYEISPAWSADLVAQFAQEADVVTTTYPAPVAINTDHYVNRAPSLESHVEGALGKLAGEDVNVALGAEYRQERFAWTASYAAPISTRRNITSAFGEVLVPLVGAANRRPLIQQLVFDVTARYDGYSDFGSSYVPKGVVRWKMSDSLSWRASYSLSFKSPTLFQLDSAPFAGVLPAPGSATAPAGDGSTLIIDGGNARLQPERTRSFELGFGYQPESLRELKFDFVARHISYTQRIDQLSQDGFSDSNVIAEAPVLGHLVTVSPSAAQVEQALMTPGLAQYAPVDVNNVAALAYLGFQNVGSMSIESFAATLHYRREFGRRVLEADLNNSYYGSYEVRITPQSAPTSLVGRAYRPVRLRSRLNVTFMQADDWAVNVRANLTGSYRNTSDPACPGEGGCPVSAWVTLDAAIQYSTPEYGDSPLRGMRVSFGVTNAFNRPPPYLYGGLRVNYDPANASPLGRTLAITITKHWGHG